ncbi:prepilin-type N-terminal cleavage/methylation domain-containing protein [Gracilibacillus caseinilyticus]|uniref:Prepilin-type N-terminal cleavage/methylation domain-containing protein n=1 Tax=Gracilibacillus caseinilyticus TaxID=2932256 RepID=A0ABY4EYP5_9BACI|nr:prepilin-type N-terminal cleavage/methylation domain-containing protein [Gracilibacillus caseinilyticus]UOQ47291.1 prepilin-type N-terminal cleavage/methylation domain-containing protein [Gracilibacillus caseinilyticus]
MKKIWKLWKEEKGFTLVELLAVIVILAIIVAIAVPAVGGIIDRAEAGANEAEAELVEKAAELALLEAQSVQDDDTSFDWVYNASGGVDIEVSELVSNGYLETDHAPSGELNYSDNSFTFSRSE